MINLRMKKVPPKQNLRTYIPLDAEDKSISNFS